MPTPEKSYSLAGKLYFSSSGWLLLHVPNDIGTGAFKALHEPGIELPISESEGRYNAHISVMRAEEVEQIGGSDKITERGKDFNYSLGHIREFEPKGWSEMERCWAIDVHSPDLEKLRKSYGLSPIPSDGKIPFHITVAVRRRKVLGNNDVTKVPLAVEGDKPTPVAKFNDKHGPQLLKLSGVVGEAVKRAVYKQADFMDAAQALAEPAVRRWVESKGMKLGPFIPHGSINDVWEEQRFNDIKTKVMREAALADPSPVKILRGLHSMFGGEWNQDKEQQAEQLHKGWANIAPYFMRLAPGFWDAVHGSTGSVASLAAAIADTHRYEGMTAEQAVEQAKAIFKDMYSDPMKHRGFSAKQLGEIYREGARRGLISRNAPPEKVVTELAPLAGAASAVRDSAQQTGIDPNDTVSIFNQLDKITPAYAGKPWEEIESRIRMNKHVARQGGLFAGAMNRTGLTVQPGPGMASMQELEQQNQELMDRASKSRVMDMVGATERLGRAELFKPGTPAAQFREKVQAGQVPNLSDGEWRQMMADSGVDIGVATQALNHSSANQLEATPENLAAIRASQHAIDGQRFEDEANRMHPGNDPASKLQRDIKLDQFATRYGYKGWGNYQQLHGQAANNIQGTLADARARGQVEGNMAHMGWKGPAERVIDEVKGPAPTASGMGSAFLGAVPEPTAGVSATPKELEPLKPLDSTIKGAAVRGIPDRNDYGDLSQLQPEQIIDLFQQRHIAARAKLHRDIRLGTPQTGLYSWATKGEGLPEPGDKQFMAQQPVHSHGYGGFSGTIGQGYGKGEVRSERKSRILITAATPTKIEFTTADTGTPERFVLFKPEKWKTRDWLMINNTPTKPPEYDKPHYKVIPAEQVESAIEQMQAGDSVSAKLDGANSIVKLLRNNVEVMSYRTSKKNNRPIVHTEKVFGTRPKVEYPKHLEGSVLRGELMAQDAEGKMLPPSTLGGILNSGIERSLQTQQRTNTELRDILFDIQQYGKDYVDPDVVPYQERRKMMEEILPYLPEGKFQIMEQATTPATGKDLWNQIQSGTHPLTHEGVVFTPATGDRTKSKIYDEHDVYVTGTFPGKGKYQGRGVGGFNYALEPEGQPVGEVGSGLSDELREQMWKSPDDYIGRIARIRAQDQHPSGAYRMPSLIALHEG